MINWLPPIPITGKVEIPGLFESRAILIWVTSPTRSVWRKAGYLRVEEFFEGEYLTVSYIAIEFGKSRITIPSATYRLSFDPVKDLTIIYPNTSISIYPLTLAEAESLNIMGINVAPSTPDVLGDEVITTVVASITNVVLDPANPARRDGFIINKSNRNLWVKFASTAATAAAPTSLVTPNSNITIPEGYTGAINGIWSGPTPTLNAEIHQFNAV
jgi:hypothetical protein